MRTTQTGDGSLTLHSERYGQTFHSHHGAVTEARHVFLDASGVAERLLRGQETRVLEVGFGTGLNCWLAADAATGAGTRLELTSLEQSLLSAATVQELGYSRELQEPALLERYLDWRSSQPKDVPAGIHVIQLSGHASLRLLLGDAVQAELQAAAFDVVWHDAFSPDANPELWQAEFLEGLAGALKPAGRLVTYTVKGEVRRALAALGLQVRKLPGPAAGKREMLVADRQE